MPLRQEVGQMTISSLPHPKEASKPPASGAPLTAIQRAQLELSKDKLLEQQRKQEALIRDNYAWYKMHYPNLPATEAEWHISAHREGALKTVAYALWASLDKERKEHITHLTQQHQVLHQVQHANISAPEVQHQHAMYKPLTQAEQFHMHLLFAEKQRAETARLLGESEHLPREPPADLPVFPNVYDHDRPLHVIMPSDHYKGKSYVVVGGGLVAFYICERHTDRAIIRD